MHGPAVLVYEEEPGVAFLALRRPERQNALSAEMLADLLEGLSAIQADSSLRALVITGDGPGFSPGFDPLDLADNRRAQALVHNYVQALAAIDSLPVLTIAAVRGDCSSEAIGLAAACDLAIGAKDASFAVPDLRVGLAPVLLIPMLARRVSERAIRELVLCGRTTPADRAREMGLLTAIVDDEAALVEAAVDQAQSVSAFCPQALADWKRNLAEGPDGSLCDRLEAAAAEFLRLLAAPEADEGFQCLQGGRRPAWHQSIDSR
ncbi:MAG TPA: enoyl-CoA hydratase/isomerase family protein [Planctomycetia bacterium]|nr:enoyl-CoA hydratase/isomerase family protein [Planctomycetia bacterium]